MGLIGISNFKFCLAVLLICCINDAWSQSSEYPTSGSFASPAEIENLTEELLTLDTNNAFQYIEMNLQEQIDINNLTYLATNRLLSINKMAYEIPTIKSLLKLYDNYQIDASKEENLTKSRFNEENELMHLFMETAVMQKTFQFLTEKGYINNTQNDFVRAILSVWCNSFQRIENKTGSSAFEAIFLAEKIGNEWFGPNNWIYYANQEKKDEFRYIGYIEKASLGMSGVAVNLCFSDAGGYPLPNTTILVGLSPELEMALYTICYYTSMNGSNSCSIKLGGQKLTITLSLFQADGISWLTSAKLTLQPPSVSPAEIENLSEELWKLDENNAFKNIAINLYKQVAKDDVTSIAPNPLLTIDNTTYEIPTIKALLELWDIYQKNASITEIAAINNEIKEDNFINLLTKTTVMKKTFQFLTEKRYFKGNLKEFEDELLRIWFTKFIRKSGIVGSSAFEAIFLSEEVDNQLFGGNNWIYFANQSKEYKFFYLGFSKVNLGMNGGALNVYFTDDKSGLVVHERTILVGLSPELEMSLYTICYYTIQEDSTSCSFKINGQKIIISPTIYKAGEAFLLTSAELEM